MLTIVDKPLIQYVYDEAREAGIEHFIFVTGRNKNVIEDHFDRMFELDATFGCRVGKKAEQEILAQNQPRSRAGQLHRPARRRSAFGHAVLVRPAGLISVGNEPFRGRAGPTKLVLNTPGCLKQMIEDGRQAWRKIQCHRGRGGARSSHPSIRQSAAWGKRTGKDVRGRRHGRESRAKGTAPSNLSITGPLHSPAGDLQDPGDPGARRPAARSSSPTPMIGLAKIAEILRRRVRGRGAMIAAPSPASSAPTSPTALKRPEAARTG